MAGKKQKKGEGALTRISTPDEFRASMGVVRTVRKRLRKFIDSPEGSDPSTLPLQMDMAHKLLNMSAKAVETVSRVRRDYAQQKDETISTMDDRQVEQMMATAALKRGWVRPSTVREEMLALLTSLGMDPTNAAQLVSLLCPDREVSGRARSTKALLGFGYDRIIDDIDDHLAEEVADAAEVRAVVEGRGDPDASN